MTISTITVKPRLVFKILLYVAIFIISADIITTLVKYLTGHRSLFGLVPLFFVDNEENIPTLFSVFILLFSAVLLAVIALFKKKEAGKGFIYWIILSLGFFYLALDEAWMIHEKLIAPMRDMFSNAKGPVYEVAWVIPALAGLVLLVLFFWKFYFGLPKKTRISFFIAGFLYIGGVVGVEILSAAYFSVQKSVDNLGYCSISTVEESLEIAGIILFIRALLDYISENYAEVHIRFGNEKGIEKQ